VKEKMKHFLDEIITYTRGYVKLKEKEIPLGELKEKLSGLPNSRDFKKAISVPAKKLHLIAEVKKASPSAGIIRKNFVPLDIARLYEENGASAISVITCEKFFRGNLRYLEIIANNVNLPVLRKDFIIDKYQVYQSRLAGADAILLIASILTKDKLAEFIELAGKLSLDCLVEVHSKEELKKVLNTPAGIIGINNRDLRTFTIDLGTTEKLARLIPEDKVIVSESGIENIQDVRRLRKSGINAILVGQTLVQSKNIKAKIKELGF
jgi:indole-3-glycerol phosphate synthase